MNPLNTYRIFGSKNTYGVVAGMALALIGIAMFIENSSTYFSRYEEMQSHLSKGKWILISHLSCSLLALFIGPFQFWKSFRDYNIETHQSLGKIYVVVVVIGAACATWLAWTSVLTIHWTLSVCLQVAAVFWVTYVTMAVRAIIQRRIQSHKEWMIRSYVLTIIFTFFQWITDLPFLTSLGSFIERVPSAAWISFVVPLFITEIILQWNSD